MPIHTLRYNVKIRAKTLRSAQDKLDSILAGRHTSEADCIAEESIEYRWNDITWNTLKMKERQVRRRTRKHKLSNEKPISLTCNTITVGCKNTEELDRMLTELGALECIEASLPVIIKCLPDYTFSLEHTSIGYSILTARSNSPKPAIKKYKKFSTLRKKLQEIVANSMPKDISEKINLKREEDKKAKRLKRDYPIYDEKNPDIVILGSEEELWDYMAEYFEMFHDDGIMLWKTRFIVDKDPDTEYNIQYIKRTGRYELMRKNRLSYKRMFFSKDKDAFLRKLRAK